MSALESGGPGQRCVDECSGNADDPSSSVQCFSSIDGEIGRSQNDGCIAIMPRVFEAIKLLFFFL